MSVAWEAGLTQLAVDLCEDQTAPRKVLSRYGFREEARIPFPARSRPEPCSAGRATAAGARRAVGRGQHARPATVKIRAAAEGRPVAAPGEAGSRIYRRSAHAYELPPVPWYSLTKTL